MIVSIRSPLHNGSSQFLPVLCSWTDYAFLTRKSLKYSFPHYVHKSIFVFPWSSAIISGVIPLLRWRPSTFWLITNFSNPASINETKAICVEVGIAFWIEVRTSFLVVFYLFAAFSQAPGPVSRTVSKPLLKSGIPAEVLMPAPVNATKCSDDYIQRANCSHF